MSVATLSLPAMAEITDWVELATRGGDGISVALLWSRSTDWLKVDVTDEKFDEAFDFEVPADEALQAFHHPFAYAAAPRCPLGGGECDSLFLHQQV